MTIKNMFDKLRHLMELQEKKPTDALTYADLAIILQAGMAKESRFVKPTVQEVVLYCIKRANNVDAQAWYDHYEANGWMVGRVKMKNWQAAVRKWEKSRMPANRVAPLTDNPEGRL